MKKAIMVFILILVLTLNHLFSLDILDSDRKKLADFLEFSKYRNDAIQKVLYPTTINRQLYMNKLPPVTLDFENNIYRIKCTGVVKNIRNFPIRDFINIQNNDSIFSFDLEIPTNELIEGGANTKTTLAVVVLIPSRNIREQSIIEAFLTLTYKLGYNTGKPEVYCILDDYRIVN
jgi:hypothetical protein